MKNLKLLTVVAVLLASNSAYSAVPVSESGGSYLTVGVNHKIKLFTTARTYTAAKTACKNLNAHLAIVSTASEAVAVNDLFAPVNSGYVGAWFGVERAVGAVPGTYTTVIPADLYYGAEITPSYSSTTLNDVTGATFQDKSLSSALVLSKSGSPDLTAAWLPQSISAPYVCEWDQF